MKKPIIVIALLASTLAGVQAQVTGTGATATATQPALPAPTAYGVVEQGANYRVWQKTTVENGTNRVHRYTELASGLNYLDPQTGQWRPSREKIDLLPAGGAFAAAATQGSHKASFPLDIASGVIQLSGPDGKQLKSRPVCLFYEDDNNSELIAVLTNSVGELVGSNQVVYPDAFEGAAASVRYTYTKAGFEQDIVIQGQLPDPAALGLNPARMRLGVLTAFFDTNNPVATPGPTDTADGLNDTTLTFGSVKMGQGRAFSIGNTEQTPPPAVVTPASWLNWITNATRQSSFSKGTPSYKRWFQLQGRNFLMEEVPYRRVSAQLQQLPPATGRLNTVSTNLFAADSFVDAIPARLLSLPASGEPVKTQTMRLSRVDWDQTPAVVLDYATVNSGSDYTFQSGSTYLVSGPCYMGTVHLYGGAVIKYANVNSVYAVQLGAWDYATAFIEVDGGLGCYISAEQPAIFTAADDDTVGETISGSTGNPLGNYYANPAIYAPGGLTLSNVRIRYAAQALWVGDSSSLMLSDSRVTDSGVMAVLGLGDGYSGPMTLTCNNCLYNCPYANGGGVVAWDMGDGGDSYNLNNCTIDNVYYLVAGPYYDSNYGCAANSIFANVQNLCVYWTSYDGWNENPNGFYNSYATFGNPQIIASGNPFQTDGGNNNYYLAADYPFRNVGSTAIDPNLLADLATLTTYAPQAGSYPDNDGMPDLGYHYPINESFDGDGLPDWWEMEWFGNLNHSGSDLDSNGNTLLYDYVNNLAPANVISFSLFTTNNYVNTSLAAVQVNVTGGWPSYQAVLVNSTNFAGATWTSYTSSNLTVNLGSLNNGDYSVWVGLRGWPTAAVQTWQEIDFTIDTTPPLLVITNPAPLPCTLGIPLVQMQGYADKQLAAFTFDVSNATGVVTGQQGIIMSQFFDTNLWQFTTNYFQCFDITLTPGTNLVTLHATDFAGNTTNCNLPINLDYSIRTNPPVVQLTWPQDGLQVSGTSFTLDGFVDDPMATVTAQVVDTSGDTNVVSGVVERTGRFWVDNLPLSGGTNLLTLSITDAAGHTSVTNIGVIQSALTLTITPPVDPSVLWQPAVTVSGTISGSGYAVSVNGVSATVNGNSWSAANVPVTPGGVACFTAMATGGGQTQAAAKSSPAKPDTVGIIVQSDTQKVTDHTDTRNETWLENVLYGYSETWTTNDLTQHWTDGAGGSATSTAGSRGASGGLNWDGLEYVWVEDSPSQSSLLGGWLFYSLDIVPYDYLNANYTIWVGDTNHYSLNKPLGCEYCAVQTNYTIATWDAENYCSNIVHRAYTRNASTKMVLLSGGRGIPGQQILHEISGWVKHIPYPYSQPAYLYAYNGSPSWYTSLPTLPNASVHLLQNTLHDDPNYPGSGSLYYVTPAGANPIDCTPTVYHDDFYAWGLNTWGPSYNDAPSFSDSPHEFVHQTLHRALTNTNLDRTMVGVGEEVYVGFEPSVNPNVLQWFCWEGGLQTNVSWTDAINGASAGGVKYTAPSNEIATLVGVTVRDVPRFLYVSFQVFQPSGYDPNNTYKVFEYTNSPYLFGQGVSGAGMHLNVVMAPTFVSFYKVEVLEVGTNASSISGYYADPYNYTNPPVQLAHNNASLANQWYPLRDDNSWPYGDDAFWYGDKPPWSTNGYSGGKFTWVIPGLWKIGSGKTNSIASGWDQKFTLGGDGTMTIKKFGQTVTRSVNSP